MRQMHRRQMHAKCYISHTEAVRRTFHASAMTTLAMHDVPESVHCRCVIGPSHPFIGQCVMPSRFQTYSNRQARRAAWLALYKDA